MKLNEKINLIRETLSNEIKPINTRYILDNAYVAPKIHSQKRLKLFSPKLGYVFATLLIISIIIPLALSQLSFKDKMDESAVPSSIYDYENNVYAFAISSTIAFIEANNIYNDSPTPSHNNEFLVYNELPYLNNFMQPVDMMLSHEKYVFRNKTSDRNGYAYKITVDGNNILGKDLNYNIYFNISNINKPIELYDFFVITDDKTYSFNGKKQRVDDKLIFQLTYLVSKDNQNYIQVSKNLNDSNDSFDYVIVKDDVTLSKTRLTLIQDNRLYCKLENLTSLEQTITFNIYSSTSKKFSVDYTISKPPLSNEQYANEKPIVMEEGQINIDVTQESTIYNFKSNNVNIIIENIVSK